jgi:Putative peptidoglycan binding domain
METTRGSRDRNNMKTKRLLSLIGFTLVALSPTTWAAGHGGGGGGFGGGGGHFGGGGGHFGGGGFGAGSRGGGVGFGGARFSGGAANFGGAGARFSSFGHPSYGRPVYSFPASRSVAPSDRAATAFNNQRNHFTSVGNRAAQVSRSASRRAAPSVRTTTARNGVGQRPTVASNRPAIASAARSSGRAGQRELNGRTDHIAERHQANWHSDWDRRHAHFDHGRFFVFDNGFWFGLDDGFFPWDYLPYYADDYYPYDYYTDDQSDTAPYDNGVPTPDPTVQAVQTQLTQLGYYNGPVNGIFDQLTRDALAKYQIDTNLTVTGSLSPDTLQSFGLPQVTRS